MGIDAEMFVRTRAKVTPKEVKRIAFDMCALFGSQRFFVNRSEGRHALSIVRKYEQDGPSIKPKAGETFVRVYLFCRYWGSGYERGDLSLICGVAEFLERRSKGGVVWYGGDSSGICAKLFDAKARAAMWDHAAGENGTDYRKGWNMEPGSEVCEFCEQPMGQCRWGRGSVGYICNGCNLHRLVTGTVKVDSERGWPDEVRS